MVDKLRPEGDALVSLIAELEKRIVGHVLFSRMWIETPSGLVSAVAPMAVLPDHQHRGIGGRLIRYGLDLLPDCGEKIVIVVGHPDYYSRFGFPARKHAHSKALPAEAFMAMKLSPGTLDGIRGSVIYSAAFGLEVEHGSWSGTMLARGRRRQAVSG